VAQGHQRFRLASFGLARIPEGTRCYLKFPTTYCSILHTIEI